MTPSSKKCQVVFWLKSQGSSGPFDEKCWLQLQTVQQCLEQWSLKVTGCQEKWLSNWWLPNWSPWELPSNHLKSSANTCHMGLEKGKSDGWKEGKVWMRNAIRRKLKGSNQMSSIQLKLMWSASIHHFEAWFCWSHHWHVGRPTVVVHDGDLQLQFLLTCLWTFDWVFHSLSAKWFAIFWNVNAISQFFCSHKSPVLIPANTAWKFLSTPLNPRWPEMIKTTWTLTTSNVWG